MAEIGEATTLAMKGFLSIPELNKFRKNTIDDFNTLDQKDRRLSDTIRQGSADAFRFKFGTSLRAGGKDDTALKQLDVTKEHLEVAKGLRDWFEDHHPVGAAMEWTEVKLIGETFEEDGDGVAKATRTYSPLADGPVSLDAMLTADDGTRAVPQVAASYSGGRPWLIVTRRKPSRETSFKGKVEVTYEEAEFGNIEAEEDLLALPGGDRDKLRVDPGGVCEGCGGRPGGELSESHRRQRRCPGRGRRTRRRWRRCSRPCRAACPHRERPGGGRRHPSPG